MKIGIAAWVVACLPWRCVPVQWASRCHNIIVYLGNTSSVINSIVVEWGAFFSPSPRPMKQASKLVKGSRALMEDSHRNGKAIQCECLSFLKAFQDFHTDRTSYPAFLPCFFFFSIIDNSYSSFFSSKKMVLRKERGFFLTVSGEKKLSRFFLTDENWWVYCKIKSTGKFGKTGNKYRVKSAAVVKMEIPVLVRSLKSSITSLNSVQMGKTFWGVVSAAVEQSRREASLVAQEDRKLGPRGWPQNPSKQRKVRSQSAN